MNESREFIKEFYITIATESHGKKITERMYNRLWSDKDKDSLIEYLRNDNYGVYGLYKGMMIEEPGSEPKIVLWVLSVADYRKLVDK